MFGFRRKVAVHIAELATMINNLAHVAKRQEATIKELEKRVESLESDVRIDAELSCDRLHNGG